MNNKKELIQALKKFTGEELLQWHRDEERRSLHTLEGMTEGLRCAFEEGVKVGLMELGRIVKARNVTEFAKNIGERRDSLYHMLSLRGNPRVQTLEKILNGLGLGLTVAPLEEMDSWGFADGVGVYEKEKDDK